MAIVAVVAMSMGVLPAQAGAAAGVANTAPASRPAPPPLPSAARSTAGLQVPVGDVRNPPELDPATGARVGLAAKPEETPAGAHLVAQSATSDTYALADGRFLVRSHSVPVNFQDGQGVFHRVDLGLVKGSDGRWRSRSSPAAASFADSVAAGATAGGDLVRLDGAGWSVGFDLSGNAAALSAVAAAGSVSYRLAAGVTLVEQATVGGVKEAIRLEAAPGGSGDAVYRFGLDVHGVTPSVGADGTVVFTAADGSVAAVIPLGAAVDSAAPVAAHSPVTVGLSGAAGSWVLTVSASGSWLRDPARVWPVDIDPSLQAGRGGSAGQDDAFVFSAYPTVTYNGAYQWEPAPVSNYVDDVGTYGADSLNTLLKWNVAPLVNTNKGIVSATLTMAPLTEVPAAGTAYAVNALAADFSSSTVTWNNQPATVAAGAARLPAAAVGASASVDVTAMVTAWANGQTATFGGWAGVRVAPLTPTTAGYSKFGAAEATGGVDPVLAVTYADVAAATIVSPPAGPGPCVRPDHSATVCPSTVGATNPTVTIAQPGPTAGHTVQYWYAMTEGNSVAPSGNSGEDVHSGWVNTLSWTPPAGSLVNGRSYTLVVYTLVDGILNNPALGAFVVRLVDPAVAATDSLGAVSVDLASGSPRVALASQSFTTAGGPIGLGLDYDPQRATTGLQGSYFGGCNGSTPGPWPTPAVTRIDPTIGFKWGNDPATATPAAGVIAPGDFCALWTGSITVPYSGVWQFGALNLSDGMIVQLGSTVVFSSWADHTAYNEFCTGVTPGACSQSLTAGTAYPVTIWYYHHGNPAQIHLGAKGPMNADGSFAAGQLNIVQVPAPWLTPPNRPIGPGWLLGAPGGAGGYTSARVSGGGVTLNTLAGPARAYTWNGTGYTPPDGETATLRWATENNVGVLKVADGATTYTFDGAGNMLSAVSGADLAAPTSPAYT